MSYDYAAVAAEMEWLKDHSWFAEKPASIKEFVGEGYLRIEKGIRPGVMAELIELFGEEVNGNRIAIYKWAMFTGAIGIGKTTMASIILPYMAHWVLCLKDPQDFFDLLPGSRIAFMQMSTSGDQARETVFGDIKARIEYSHWFMLNYPFDPKYTNQIRFPQKDIWVLPGDSAETTFEGYNILGGILDEADSHKVTKDKDYADQGWNTINSRIESRFQDRGFLLTVGQMKKASGFAKAKYDELNDDPENAHTVRMTIWESLGWDKFLKADGSHDSFWYDIRRKEIVPEGTIAFMDSDSSKQVIEIPTKYRKGFETKPEMALRDLAGIPPAAGDPFISLTHKLDEAVERWNEHYDFIGSPVDDNPTHPQFAEWFTAQDSLKRAVHLDVAYSSEGDALGLAMGHVSHMVDIEGELKPYIVIDFMLRIKAAAGTEIFLQEVRRMIYDLADNRKFKIRSVTMDGFQSTDTMQQLRKRRLNSQYLSVDRSKLPYEDLRDAIYEDRIEWPPYFTYLERGSDKKIQIVVKELSELEDDEKKIDHPKKGSKDVADCLAGVVNTLMGDRVYRRNSIPATDGAGVPSSDPYSVGTGKDLYGNAQESRSLGNSGLQAPAPSSLGAGLQMPMPPSLTGTPRRGR